ncbi:hypothetical protein BEN47_03075 [Hymenobacter lapidarius]|uniref:Uncharacterized protein n=1 Tax=Hymenobacter lapidarius TaxID=1908237 RepID=A0A1G1T0G4_9BACT|nr:hypothetical protein [Hymenobacter lapidarius]OGX84359.1 hypothetical protein BEN47_03075 [Hymenobacter lapidarius]
MKLNLFSKALLALGLPLLLGVSCEEPEPEPDAVPLPAELKAYVLFQPGTHWIYQDSATQQLDSVWVVSTKLTEVRQGGLYSGAPINKYEVFEMRTRSSQGGPDQVFGTHRLCGANISDDGDENWPCWVVTRGESLPNSTADVGGAYVFPYIIVRDRARTDFLAGGMQPYWHTRPLALGARTYPDVMEVSLPRGDASQGGWPAYYAWAPNVGIVRQRVVVQGVPHTRALLRSRIVQ